jgi:hypothetical protein
MFEQRRDNPVRSRSLHDDTVGKLLSIFLACTVSERSESQVGLEVSTKFALELTT